MAPVIPSISEFEASLVYIVSSRTVRAIQRNPVKKKTKKPKNQNKLTQKNLTKCIKKARKLKSIFDGRNTFKHNVNYET